MKNFMISFVLFLGTSHITLAIPTWPSPAIDELEDIRFLMSGYLRRGFSDFVTPCSFSAAGNARITAAEWIRTAYHDMSTADVVAGTGGLDASITFETDRSENIGVAFNSTFASILPYYTYRSSMADLIALTVLTSVSACGGPTIPYRTGRIDATEAGPTGVPEPSDNMTTITEKFARQGFNSSDMITLVACGHTIGGVHGEDFPTIVVDNGTSGSRFSHFDSTVKFDNTVATEYIVGNTSNPLVVGPDSSNRSDQRVFSSDGNVTMNLLTDPVTFQDRCATVMQRMIDTVPSNVVLTDPLEAYEIKPAQLKLKLSTDGSNITFSGAIRVRTTVRPVENIASITLLYTSRDGLSTGTINTTKATFKGGSSSGFTETFYWYEFSTQLSANTSISSFNVTATLNDGSVENHDNNGVGFPVQSNIMLQADSSCRYYNETGDSFMKVVAAVHNSRSSKNVDVVSSIRIPRQGTLVPRLDTMTNALTFVNSTGPYDIYAATVKLTAAQTTTTYIDLVSGADDDKEVDLFKNINGWNACTD